MIRPQFSHRHQGKSPLMKTWVRDYKMIIIKYQLIIKQDVNIDRPAFVTIMISFPAQITFNL